MNIKHIITLAALTFLISSCNIYKRSTSTRSAAHSTQIEIDSLLSSIRQTNTKIHIRYMTNQPQITSDSIEVPELLQKLAHNRRTSDDSTNYPTTKQSEPTSQANANIGFSSLDIYIEQNQTETTNEHKTTTTNEQTTIKEQTTSTTKVKERFTRFSSFVLLILLSFLVLKLFSIAKK